MRVWQLSEYAVSLILSDMGFVEIIAFTQLLPPNFLTVHSIEFMRSWKLMLVLWPQSLVLPQQFSSKTIYKFRCANTLSVRAATAQYTIQRGNLRNYSHGCHSILANCN